MALRGSSVEWLLLALKSPAVEPPEGLAYWGAAEIVRGGAEPPPMTRSCQSAPKFAVMHNTAPMW
jgi:hypothetical protein